METSVIPGWTDFLVASAGVLAALAGLMFISLSINLAKILEQQGLVGRAAETIMILSGSLTACLICLIPHLSTHALALALGTVGFFTWIGPTGIQIRCLRRKLYYKAWYEVVRAVIHQIATLPAILAAFALVGLVPGGFVWFGAGVVLSILATVLNAWVLLVEILR